MCQGEPGPPATLWPRPYGPTLLVSTVTPPTAPQGPKLGTLSLHRGQARGCPQGLWVPALPYTGFPGTGRAGLWGSGPGGQPQGSPRPGVPPETRLHTGG